jgi:hypothetical protein
MACLLPFCFKLEFRKLRCRVIIRAGVPVNPPAPVAFENDIMAKYRGFTFDCLGDGCECTLGAPGAWQAFNVLKQNEPYTLNGAAYVIDYSLRFEVRLTWGTCAPPKKAAGGGKKKAAKKRRR